MRELCACTSLLVPVTHKQVFVYSLLLFRSSCYLHCLGGKKILVVEDGVFIFYKIIL
jgi:hypothetical protein